MEIKEIIFFCDKCKSKIIAPFYCCAEKNHCPFCQDEFCAPKLDIGSNNEVFSVLGGGYAKCHEVTFSCNMCNKKVRTPLEFLGKKAPCPYCNFELIAPIPDVKKKLAENSYIKKEFSKQNLIETELAQPVQEAAYSNVQITSSPSLETDNHIQANYVPSQSSMSFNPIDLDTNTENSDIENSKVKSENSKIEKKTGLLNTLKNLNKKTENALNKVKAQELENKELNKLQIGRAHV